MRQDETSSRRTFLRGAGLTLALPWLESLPVRSEETGKRTSPGRSSKPPVRFACVYFSNGVEPEHWWARGSGKSMKVGPGLRPLQPYCEEIVFLQGLFNEQAVKNSSAHLGRMPNMLSGAWVSLDQNDIRVGQTMDQVVARRIGNRTTIPSLVLGIEPTGNTISVPTIDIMRFADGKMVEHWGVTNELTMMQNLGIIPEG